MSMDLNTLLSAMQATVVKPVPVTVPGWGDIFVRAQTVEEVDALEGEPSESKADDEAALPKHTRLARSACAVICDADGKRLLNPSNPEHVALVGKQPWPLLRMVLAKANGKDDDAGNV